MKNKVIHVITGLGTGGAEAMLYKLVTNSNGTSENIVISLTQGGKYKSMLEANGIVVQVIDFKSLFSLPLKLYQLASVIEKQKPDIVMSWMYHAIIVSSILWLFSFRKRKIPLLWNVRHSLIALDKESRSIRAIIKALRFFSRIPARVLFNSAVSAKQHNKIWRTASKTVVIGNGFIKTDSLSHNGHIHNLLQHEKQEAPLVIGHVGRAHPMKNHATLVSAFLRCKEHYPNIILVLVGKGTESLRLPSVSVDNAIWALGERDDVSALMNEFDYFVLPSAWGEGFPNVLGEAMLAQNVCVTTDVGDSGIVLNDKRWIVSPGDDDMLYAKMLEMLSLSTQEREQIGRKNKRHIESHYSIEAITQQYANLYHTLGSAQGR